MRWRTSEGWAVRFGATALAALLWLVWVAEAWAGMRVALVGLGAEDGPRASLEAEVASELERRGATPLVMQDPDNELEAESVSPRSVRRFAFARDVDAVVIGRSAEAPDGSEADFEVDVYSGQSGVRLGRQARPRPAPDRGARRSGIA